VKKIRVDKYGGPEDMILVDVFPPEPEKGEVLVRLEAIGVNFIDIYQRAGLYRNPLPFTPGNEGAGVVVQTGQNVHEVARGDRVAYAGVLGSYAEYAVVPAQRLVKLPDGIDARTAAALMLQGMTAHYLTHSTYPLKRGDTCLVHAAAGGVGLLLVQMAKSQGARVIGTASTPEKAELARSLGADAVIPYAEEDFGEDVKQLTDGRGVQVVYDSVGQATFDRSLDCLVPRGYLVLFGQSSGPVPPFDPQVLNAKGSLFLTRPSLAHYTATREELLERANDVLGWAASGKLAVRIGAEIPLAEAAEAHRLLSTRRTSGKVLLLP
jgi:NADPH:quinone reductase